MVLDPKTHNEYGTIYTQDILPHTFLDHKTSLPLQLSPTSIPLQSSDRGDLLSDRSSTYSATSPINNNNNNSQTILTTLNHIQPQKSAETPTEKSATAPDTGSANNMADLHQRQPLIPSPNSSPDRWTQKDTSMLGNDFFEDDDSGDDSGVGKKSEHHIVDITQNASGASIIRDEQPRYPKEKCKTFIAFILMLVNFLLTTASLAVIHERVPDRDKYPPLSDMFLDNVTETPIALNVSEYIIIILCNSSIVLCFFHKHRFIVFRRLFLIMSILYFYRSITMYVTVLPMSSKSYYCSPKSNETSSIQVMGRVVQLISGMGLAINGKHSYCGDYIYSGHTVILVLSSCIIAEYTPRKLYLLHWFVYLWAFVGVVLILVAHGHYTIDVIVAYYITTRVFWIYHTLCNNQSLKSYQQNNYLSRSFWFPFFLFFERNVGGVVPIAYDWPLPWPRRFLSKHPNRNS